MKKNVLPVYTYFLVLNSDGALRHGDRGGGGVKKLLRTLNRQLSFARAQETQQNNSIMIVASITYS